MDDNKVNICSTCGATDQQVYVQLVGRVGSWLACMSCLVMYMFKYGKVVPEQREYTKKKNKKKKKLLVFN